MTGLVCFVSFQPGHPGTEEVEPPFQELEFKACQDPPTPGVDSD